MVPNEPAAVHTHARFEKRSLIIALFLIGATAALYASACDNGFVDWDDNLYVAQQPHVLQGIGLNGLTWAATANVSNNWHPLTLVSLQLDAQLFGSEPLGFHRTSVLIHAINAALVFCCLRLLTGSQWRSALVAALFAVHPLRVESVAWISERKDLLSGFFFFLTIMAYVYYVRAPSVWRYFLVAALLLAGLSSKSMLVTTPCVLLLLDYWPLDRFSRANAGVWQRFCVLSLEKVPWLGLSAFVSLLTVLFQSDAMSNWTKLPMNSRLENAVRGTAAYLLDSGWPVRLSHIYPIPESSSFRFAVAALILAAITVVAVWLRKRRPYLIVGWFWFLGMLVPVCGLVQVGFQQRADRYTYLPQIGLFIAVVWVIADAVHGSKLATRAWTCVALFILVGWSWATVQQIPVWRDSKSLWTHAYAVEPQNRLAILHILPIAFNEGDHDEAIRLAQEAVAIQDRFNREFLMQISEILGEQGEFGLSVQALDSALKDHSDAQLAEEELLFRRGEAFAAQGRWEDAARDYRRVTELTPAVIPLQFCLAHALTKCGREDEAKQITSAALQRFPQFSLSAAQSAWATSTNPDSTRKERFKAVCLAEEANLVSGGQRADYLDVLAVAYAANHQFEEAIQTTERAITRAELQRQTDFATRLRSRLELYRQRKPYVETAPGARR